MKSKNVKLPLELVEAIEKRNSGKPLGEVLLEIYKEYERLEGLARSIAYVEKRDSGKINVSDTIIRYTTSKSQDMTKFEETLSELRTMVVGLEIFLKKVKTS